MEAIEVERGGSGYSLKPSRLNSEDILFCIDVNPESSVEIKTTGSNGRPITRMDSIKQAILLFVHAKLSMNPDHRFAFTTVAKSAIWLKKEFSSDIAAAEAAVRGLGATTPCSHADLTSLFRVAAHEARKSTAQNRILRVILIYCRSSTRPQHQWPVNQKVFTFDVIYLHEKPGPDNCPQEVYDALVDALDHVSQYEGYIFESGQGIARILYRCMCLLLSHPQQRISLDDLDIPKPLTKKLPPADSVPAAEVVPVTSQ
ncbi:BRISC and BRCA1-A complex member 1 [Benincasa hispida]|uniref:BRISC and BRCA1-A complex member 1 n=1 Tax=Benincasa hispida TaxID=102211 RepID=UPI0018FFB3F4|nr:BRISC and BRCA1-A complex member 1 [Benincasa hispida]